MVETHTDLGPYQGTAREVAEAPVKLLARLQLFYETLCSHLTNAGEESRKHNITISVRIEKQVQKTKTNSVRVTVGKI